MNVASAFGRVLLLPFAAKEIVGFDFEELLKDQRKTLGRRLFESQYFDVVVVDTKKSPMTLDAGLCKVIIEKGVVFEPCVFDLEWREVQNLFQNAEGFLFI